MGHIFGTKNVGVLVGGPRHLGRQWLVSEGALPLVLQLLVGLVVGLRVEDVGAHVVVVTGGSVVVNHVLVGMAQHVRPILSLLQVSGFHLNLIFIR